MKLFIRAAIGLSVLLLLAGPASAQAIVGNTNIGLTNSLSCTGDANCTLIGHVRFLDKVWNDIWSDSDDAMRVKVINGSCVVANEAATETAGCVNTAGVSAWLKAYGKAGSSTWDRIAYGQGLMNASLPVALASNQPPVSGTLKSGAITSAMTGTTSTAVIVAQASNYLYVTSCAFSNTHASVTTMMLLQDGSGGTTLWEGIVPFGGGSNITFPAPLKVPTLGNALYTANVTTGSSTFASCSGFYSTASY